MHDFAFNLEDLAFLIIGVRPAILNKLSLTNFQKLANDFTDINFDTPDLLEKAVGIIIQKAQEENIFAKLCADLLSIFKYKLGETNQDKNNKPSQKDFMRLVLLKCEEEFNKTIAVRIWQVDQNADLSEEEKEEKKLIEKKRYLGHIEFIGELFNHDLIRDQVAFSVIQELITQGEMLAGSSQPMDVIAAEQHLESYCKIMRITGRKMQFLQLNSPIYKKIFDESFQKCTKLSNGKQVSVRVRCLLKDILDLKANGFKLTQEMMKLQNEYHEQFLL